MLNRRRIGRRVVALVDVPTVDSEVRRTRGGWKCSQQRAGGSATDLIVFGRPTRNPAEANKTGQDTQL